MKRHSQDFNGAVISLRIEGDEYSHDLVAPQLVDMGGRMFVVGEVPAGATVSGWTDGTVSGVAWDKVINYVVFESVKSYYAAISESDKYEEMAAGDRRHN